jgi:glycosyltransferase involved in cell wall biosynthesis
MKIVALLTVRNEERYVARCIRHLHEQGIEICLIDNESTDRTMAIVSELRHLGVYRVETQPYPGFFSLSDQCRLQERLARDIDADWFIHHDADEIRESDHGPSQTLRDAIAEIDAQGFTAINFDEFVFVPSSEAEECREEDFTAALSHYYFFQPAPNHRVNAWKKLPNVAVDLTSTGGHGVLFEGRTLADRCLVLRHYPALSAAHAQQKYGSSRVYDPEEMASRGWHVGRESWKTKRFRYPDPVALKRHVEGARFETSEPKSKHLFFE